MKKLLTAIITIHLSILLYAQDDISQILIFRNTGEVNLIWSNELDSICLSQWDADSVWHEVPVVQRFHTKDSTLVVPVEEIDSVAFGERNEAKLYDGVKMISDEDLQWIIRCDGKHLYYKTNTPENVLPTVGLRLFAQQQEMFPIGLCAKVTATRRSGNEIDVTVSDIDLSAVFERLFYAGKAPAVSSKSKNFAKAPVWNAHHSLLIGKYGSVDIGLNLDVEVNNIVVQPLRGYYHIDLDISRAFATGFSLSTGQSFALFRGRERVATIPLGVFAYVFTPEITLEAFVELNAELSASLSYNHEISEHITWTSRRGQEPVFTYSNNHGEFDNLPRTDMDITFDGEFFCGAEIGLDLNILKELTGCRLKMAAGPALSGKFGAGLLTRAQEKYDASVYNSATLNSCVQTQATATLYTRGFLDYQPSEIELFKHREKLFERTVDLFPRYERTCGVAAVTQQEKSISVATQSNNEILHSVETGFELVNSQDEVIDSVFVANIQEATESVQGIESTLSMPKTNISPKDLKVRPVFHYAGYTIKAPDVNVHSDMFVQPVVAMHSNGVITALTGIPVLGSAKNDSTLFIAGPWLPVLERDTIFRNKTYNAVPNEGYLLSEKRKDDLIGTWYGNEFGVNVTYTFKNDGTGEFYADNKRENFKYQVNQPIMGRILLIFEESNRTKILYVRYLTEEQLKYTLSSKKEVIVLNKTE